MSPPSNTISDNTSTTSSRSSKKKSHFVPLIKKAQDETVIMFDPPNGDSSEIKRMFEKETDDNMFFNHMYKARAGCVIDSIRARNKDDRTYMTAERTDMKTQYYIFRKGCNCSRPCSGKCSKPVLFVQKVKAVYNGRLITKTESDRIRKSEREQMPDDPDLQNDKIAIANNVLLSALKGTEVGKSIENSFKLLETGYNDADDGMLSKKSRKRTKKDTDDGEGGDGGEEGDDKVCKIDDDVPDMNEVEEVDAANFSDDSEHCEVEGPAVDADEDLILADEDNIDDDDEKSTKKNTDKGTLDIDEDDEYDEDESISEVDKSSEEEDEMKIDEAITETGQLKILFKQTFVRNGGKIHKKQMHSQIGVEVEKNAQLKEWYNKNTTVVKKLFNQLTKLDLETGIYTFRG